MNRKLVRLVMAVMMVGLTIGSAAGVSADAAYTCPDNTCTFSVPDYYSKINSDGTSITFKDPDSGGVFAVVLVTFPGLSTLDDTSEALVAQFAMSDGYQPDPAGVQTGKLSGVPARSFTFLSNNDKGTQVKTAVFYAVYKDHLYALTFATTPDKEDAFVQSAQGVFDSWMFT